MAASQTINHAVKRTLLNALDWYEFIKQKVVPKFSTDPTAAHENMTKTLDALVSGAREAAYPSFPWSTFTA